MKRIILLAIGLVLSISSFAQVPQKMTYQAVIRNTTGALIVSAPVGMQISILIGTVSGPLVYVERHTPVTNLNGMVTLEIGTGLPVLGSFPAIDWSTGTYFLKTETDPTGGTAYTITGTQQLMTVPYAFFAEKSGRADRTIYADSSAFSDKSDSADWSNFSDTSDYALRSGDTTTWLKSGLNIYYKKGKVGIGTDNPNGPFEVYSTNLNNPSFYVSGYVTDNAGEPAIATVRGLADGGAILEVSKQKGAARNWGMIRLGTDGSFGQIFGQDGNIGINIAPPQRALHVNDVMRLEPRSSAPSNPGKGDIYFDGSTNKLRVYDGSAWQNCW